MVLPAKLRKQSGIRKGDVFSVEATGEDTFLLHRLKKAEPQPAKLRFFRTQAGHMAASLGHSLDMAAVQKALEEFP